MSAAIDSIIAKLSSEKATVKKEGVRSLFAALESDAVLATLDSNTTGCGNILAASWPGLCSVLCRVNKVEITKKTVHQDLFKLLKAVVTTASDTRRSGNAAPLLQRASKLFSHLQHVLSIAGFLGQGVRTTLVRDYVDILQGPMLSTPAYCYHARRDDVQGLLDKLMQELESSSLARFDEVLRMLSILHSLLATFVNSLSIPFISDVAEFLCQLMPRLQSWWGNTRVMATAFAVLNSFLLGVGLDVGQALAVDLFEVGRPALRANWQSNSGPLHAALRLNASIHLQLGHLQEADIEEVVDLVTQDVACMTNLGWHADRGPLLCPLQQAVASLQAKALMRRSRGGIWPDFARAQSADLDDCVDRPSAKRQKVAPYVPPSAPATSRTHTDKVPLSLDAVRWLLAAVAWHEQGVLLPRDSIGSWQPACEAALQQLQTADSSSEPSQALTTIWVLRFLQQLALHCQPPASVSATGNAAKDCKVSSRWAGLWQAIWDRMWQCVQQADISTPIAVEALELLTIIAERTLSNAAGCLQVAVTTLSKPPPELARPVLDFIRTLACMDLIAMDHTELRLQVVEYVIEVASAGGSHRQAADALMALVHVPIPTSGSEEDSGQLLTRPKLKQPWCSEEASETAVELNCLLRGEDLLRSELENNGVPQAAHQTLLASQPTNEPTGLLLRAIYKGLQEAICAATAATERDKSFLPRLLGYCCTFVTCASAVASAASLVKDGSYNQWQPLSLKTGAMSRGVETAARLWATQLPIADGGIFQLSLWTDLSAAMHQYNSFHQHPIQWQIEAALTAVETAWASADDIGQPTGSAAGGSETAAGWDDDLDMAPTLTAAPTVTTCTATNTTPVAIRLGTVRRLELMAVMQQLARLAPDAAATQLLAILDGTELEPASQLHLATVAALCAAAAEGSSRGVQAAVAQQLGVTGLMGMPMQPFTAVAMFDQLRVLLTASTFPTDMLVELLQTFLAWVATAEDGGSTGANSWQVRVELLQVVHLASEDVTRAIPVDVRDHMTERAWALLQDQTFRARVAASRLIVDNLISDKYAEGSCKVVQHHLRLASTIANTSANATAINEPTYETSILTLGRLMIAYPITEVQCLWLLLTHAASCQGQQQLVSTTLTAVALAAGYLTRAAYIRVLAWPLLTHWFKADYSFQQLLDVKHILTSDGCSTAAFAKAWAAVLVPVMVVAQLEDELAFLAEQLGVQLPSLLLQHLAAVYGASYPAATSDNATGQRAAHDTLFGGVIARQVPETQRAKFESERVTGIVSAILLMAGGPNPQLAFFPVDHVVRAIMQLLLAGRSEEELWTQVLFAEAVATMLSAIHTQVMAARAPQHQLRALQPLRALLVLLDKRMCEVATARYSLHILLQLMDRREVQAECCELAEMLIKQLYKNRGQLAKFAPVLQQVLARVSECLDSSAQHGRPQLNPLRKPSRAFGYSRAGRDAAVGTSPELLRLLRLLTVDAPVALRPMLATADPLPAVGEIEDIGSFLQLLQREQGPRQQLLQFTSRAAALAPSLRQRSLLRLSAAVHADPASLFAELGSEGPADGAAAAVDAEVVDAIWALSRLSTQLHDNRMAELAGELLALLGPLSSSAVAFDPHALARPVILQSPAANGKSGGHAPSKNNGRKSAAQQLHPAPPWMAAALRHLYAALLDEDVAIIKIAQITLRRLLACPSNHAVVDGLEELPRAHLSIFLTDGSLTPKAADLKRLQDKLRHPELLSLRGKGYKAWVCDLAALLLPHASSAELQSCRAMASRRADFAEAILPHALADLAVNVTDPTVCQQLSKQVAEHILPPAIVDAETARLLLSCLEHLRSIQLAAVQQDSTRVTAAADVAGQRDPRDWESKFWLALDYLSVASLAVGISATFTGLLYVEHHVEAEQHSLILPPAADGFGQDSQLSEVNQLLLQIYTNMEEPDGLYAIARSAHPQMQCALFAHEGSWSRALVASNSIGTSAPAAALNLAGPSAGGLSLSVQALQQLSCYWHVATMCAGLPAHERSRMSEAEAESSWRLGTWADAAPQTPAPTTIMSSNAKGAPVACGFHAAVCSCLGALAKGDRTTWGSCLSAARQDIVASLGTLAAESTAGVSPALLCLQMLQTLSEAWVLRWPPSAAESSADAATAALDAVQHRWQQRECIAGSGGRYSTQEPLLALRRATLHAAGFGSHVPAALADAAKVARKAGQLHQGMAAIQELRATVTNLQSDTSRCGSAISPYSWREADLTAWRVEAAKQLWAGGQAALAVAEARAVLSTAQKAAADATAVMRICCLLGTWLAETRADSSSVVLDLLQQAVASSTSESNSAKGAAKAHFRLAQYADSQYRNLEAHRRSPEWTAAQAVLADAKKKLRILEEPWNLRYKSGQVVIRDGKFAHTADAHLYHNIKQLRLPIEADEADIAARTAKERTFRQTALQNYGKCLEVGDAFDLVCIFRLVQMWLELAGVQEVVSTLAFQFEMIVSHKFLPLVYQMASRLTGDGPAHLSGFQACLRILLTRLAAQHPHHTLYHLLALRNGNRDCKGAVITAAAQSHGAMSRSIDQDKVVAAEKVLQSVAGSSPTNKVRVAEAATMADVYIDLAAAPVSKNAVRAPLPRATRSAAALTHVPVATAPIEVDPSARYEGLPHFVRFKGDMRFVGGINQPKLVMAVDSAGREFRQLVKSGNDDLRQDAVMQQFFGLVNSLLGADAETARRHLGMVVYKVVAFTPFAGLVAWAEHTVPLAEYLTGRDRGGGAHGRYARPGDWSYKACVHHLSRTNQSVKTLRERFDEVCAHFRPAFHHFFLETYPTAAAWFERRLTYTRSVAVSSMAGYLIGLGDRHSQNILIDTRTAEVVHIDLGVAFEQGRFLPTPETVPFRLTRDIVDGFGLPGVEGVMRRCCEETMRVLRANKESLLTIIQVFIHDPLFKWGLSPVQKLRRQGGEAEAAPSPAAPTADAAEHNVINADAERTVMRVHQKLLGTEQGDGEGRAVGGQVQQLLSEAQDPENLCALYVGWAPWL